MVLKLNAQGHLIFSSYFGSSTRGNGIAVDNGGNAYLAGNAGAIPATSGAFQTSSTGSYGFLAKFSSQGALNYATYLGGPGGSYASAVAVDAFGSAYVAGYTFASTFPGAPGGGAQPYNRGSNDAFVAKVNATGSALSYFTFLGGSGSDFANSISLDSSNNAYVAGATTSGDFYVTDGALQTAYSFVPSPFLAKLNASGSQLLYSTYLGSARPVYQYGLAVDAGGNAYVAGTTADSLATAGAAQSSLPNTSALFQTTNLGASWSAYDGALGGTPAAISPDPQNEGYMVAVTDLGIFRTINNGASWTRQLPGAFVGLSRSPASSNVLYASTGTQVFYSTNNGVTWSITQTRAVASATILADPLNANTAYAVTSGQAISKTTDGGTTWTTLAGPGTFTVDSFLAAPNGTLFLDTNLGVFASTDHGASWNAMNTGLTPLAGVVNGLTVSAANSLVLYRSAGTPTIYSSSDGGATWAPVAGALPYNAGALAASARRRRGCVCAAGQFRCGSGRVDHSLYLDRRRRDLESGGHGFGHLGGDRHRFRPGQRLHRVCPGETYTSGIPHQDQLQRHRGGLLYGPDGIGLGATQCHCHRAFGRCVCGRNGAGRVSRSAIHTGLNGPQRFCHAH